MGGRWLRRGLGRGRQRHSRSSWSSPALVVLTNWLIARRAAAFEHTEGSRIHRPLWALRAGCLVPFVNLCVGTGASSSSWPAPRSGHGPAAPADRRGGCAWCPSARGFGVLDRDEFRHRRPGHRQQHRRRRWSPTSSALAAMVLVMTGPARLRPCRTRRGTLNALGDRRRRATIPNRPETRHPTPRPKLPLRLSPKARTRQHRYN